MKPFLLAFPMVWLATTLNAQDKKAEIPSTSFLEVKASQQVFVPNDRVTISGRIEAKTESVSDAQRQVSDKATAWLSELKGIGIEDAAISIQGPRTNRRFGTLKTASGGVTTDYDKIVGYTSSLTVTIETSDFPKAKASLATGNRFDAILSDPMFKASAERRAEVDCA